MKIDGMPESLQIDKRQQDLESTGSYSPPFLPTESLVDDDHETSPTITSLSDHTHHEQAPCSRLRLILPAAYYIRGHGFQEITRLDNRSFSAYLSYELDVSRLNTIQQSLWFAGLERVARSLQQNVLLGRQIIVTEQTDMHMVWHDSKIFMKPLPEFLLCHSVWERDLCRHPELYGRGLGLLSSYLQLVRAKSDLRIAHANGLLPVEISWEQWTKLSRALHRHISPQAIDSRYKYGELRLARLNWIYRFRGHIFRAYAPQESRGWLVGSLVYIAIVLTAMQVGLTTNHLSGSLAFQRASYGFTVFSIMGPVIVLCGYWGGMTIFILWNLLFTWRYMRRLEARR